MFKTFSSLLKLKLNTTMGFKNHRQYRFWNGGTGPPSKGGEHMG